MKSRLSTFPDELVASSFTASNIACIPASNSPASDFPACKFPIDLDRDNVVINTWLFCIKFGPCLHPFPADYLCWSWMRD